MIAWLHLACWVSAAVAHWDWMVRGRLEYKSLSVSQQKSVQCLVIPHVPHVARLPTPACASMHAPCAPCWTASKKTSFVQQRYAFLSSFYLKWDGCSLEARGRCHSAFGRWGRLVGLLCGCTERHAFGCISDPYSRTLHFSFLRRHLHFSKMSNLSFSNMLSLISSWYIV